MEQMSSKTLSFRHISTATNEAVEYIRKRKNHEIQSLRTRWNYADERNSVSQES